MTPTAHSSSQKQQFFLGSVRVLSIGPWYKADPGAGPDRGTASPDQCGLRGLVAARARTDSRIHRLKHHARANARPAPPQRRFQRQANRSNGQPGESLQAYKNRLLDMAKQDLISAGPGGQYIDIWSSRARLQGRVSATP